MLNAAKGCVLLDASRLIVFTTMAVVQMVLRTIIDCRCSLHHPRRKRGNVLDHSIFAIPQHRKQVRAFYFGTTAIIARVRVEALNQHLS